MKRTELNIKKRYPIERTFVAPACIIVAIATQVPFVLTIIFSLLRWNIVRPDQGITFAGLNNFIYYLKDKEFYTICLQTVGMIGAALILCMVLGYLIALMLDSDIPGKTLSRTLILSPFFIMTTTTGVLWKTTILNTNFGWVGTIANMLGMKAVDFVSYYARPLLVFLFVWQWMPFFVLVLLGGLQGIPTEVLERANLDGCSKFEMVFKIKLPMIFNHMQVALMLGLIFLVKEFGLILTTTSGGPGQQTYTLTFYIYRTLFSGSNVGRAAALSVITVVVTLTIINLIFRAIKKRRAVYE
ncbi:carbohydrate ABC transporter permease [Eubacterium sp. ER2]|uniref:carbohydrate ABC transporter permease n=1 Tax=Eubacterium sp. ER2 TaxID=1519438 RepID=UPI00051BD523|nr:sugar ABC transporter permease [Eubacterium sp. ER2]